MENYTACRDEVRAMLLSLARLGTSPFPLSTAAVAVGLPAEEIQNLIDELIDSHLLEVVDDAPDCYRLHHLVWAMARERTHAEGVEQLSVGRAGMPYAPAVRARLPAQRALPRPSAGGGLALAGRACG
ncbi:hypothetical protein ACIOHO_28070 [Streptomyces sp. NPDC087849]|uniref:hypothetical protein n=1 Tax=Streptomyces sp. NPDC087849 TaxID=3365808 RepID=UPI0038040214